MFRDAALLSRTLDSTSSSDTEDDFSHQKQAHMHYTKVKIQKIILLLDIAYLHINDSLFIV